MSLLLERLKEACTNHTFVATLGKLMACITPLIVLKEQLQLCANSFIPSYIARIVHFDTKYARMEVKYIGNKNRFSIKNAHSDLMDLPDTGYYMIHVWNRYSMKYEYYLLRADLLVKALGLRNMNCIWAFHDYGIIQLLSNFVEYTLMDVKNSRILAITVNGKDESKPLKPFMNSIHIPNNITPFVLYMLSQYMKGERMHYVDAKTTSCVYCDENLNEVCIKKPNEYLLQADQEMKCPLCCNISYTTSESKSEAGEDAYDQEKDKDA